jgi:hypothetical protein
MANIKDLNEKIKELKNSIDSLGREGSGFKIIVENIEQAINSGGNLNKQAQALARVELDILKTQREINNELGNTFSIFQDINQELSRNNSTIGKIRNATRDLESIASKLLNRREKVSILEVKDLKRLKQESAIKFKDLERERDYLKNKKESNDISDREIKFLSEIEGILNKNTGLQSSFNRQLEATLHEQKAIEDSMGLTGAALRAITHIPGLGEIAKYLNVDTAIESMEKYLQKQIDITKESSKFRDRLTSTNLLIQEYSDELSEIELNLQNSNLTLKEITKLEEKRNEYAKLLNEQTARRAEIEREATEEATSGLTKINMLIEGGKDLGRGFIKAITSIEAITLAVTQSFLKFNQANREARQLTGQTADNFSSMNMALVSTIDQVNTITSLSRELRLNTNAAFSPETILAATELSVLMGISEESTANLALLSEAFGFNLDKVTKESIKIVSNFNKINKSAVNYQQVIEDVGKASAQLTLTLGQNPQLLVNAAAAAAKLGVSLKEVEQIADSLIQFESSIRAELEAELLTGKQLNLERARYAALTNDIEGLTKEILDNEEILNSFTTGNRIQQQAIAKSLGISTDQLGKIILQNRVNLGLTDEQAAKAANISEEDLKRLTVQEKIQKSIEKITSAFAPLLEMVASLLGNTVSLSLVLGGIATMGFAQLINSLRIIQTSLKVSAIAAAWKSAFSGPQSMLTGGIAGAVIGAGLTALIMSSINKADDLISPGYGKRILSSPEGTYALNNNDTIVAGTNLMPNINPSPVGYNTNLVSNPKTSPTATTVISSDNKILEQKIDKLISVIENALIPAVKQDKVFALDGKKFAVATAVSRS